MCGEYGSEVFVVDPGWVFDCDIKVSGETLVTVILGYRVDLYLRLRVSPHRIRIHQPS